MFKKNGYRKLALLIKLLLIQPEQVTLQKVHLLIVLNKAILDKYHIKRRWNDCPSIARQGLL